MDNAPAPTESAPAIAAGGNATPTPNPAPAAPAGSSTSDAWYSGLEPDIQKTITDKKLTDPSSLARSYHNLEKKLGVPHVEIPQDSWDEKRRGDFYNKLGRPEKADGYEFKALDPAVLPKGLNYAPEQDKWFADVAHKLGFTKAQAQGAREAWINKQVEDAKGWESQSAQKAADQEKALLNLKAEYGPKWEATVDGANKVINEFGGDEFKALINEYGIGNDPRAVRFLGKLAAVLHDHSVITGTPRMSGNFGDSPSSALSEIARLKTDKDFTASLTKGSHPKHDEHLKKWQELHRTAFPSKSS